MADASESCVLKSTSVYKCGCTGIRKCLLCQNEAQTNLETTATKTELTVYSFCSKCGKTAFTDSGHICDDTSVDRVESRSCPPILDGVTVIEDFITEDEETFIVGEIDETEWKISQSGRWKQDYGPQVNFKRKKVKTTYFNGLPLFSKFIVERMNNSVKSLADFIPVELCNLDYNPERGSAIDPHIDDCWLWGKRLVTLNLLSSTKLTMTKEDLQAEIPIVLPRRSLIIVEGPARYEWEHGIKRDDIHSRRMAVTLRELSQEFFNGGKNEKLGSLIIDTALTFQGKSVQTNMNSLNIGVKG